MYNFRTSFPTEVFFGEGQVKVIAKELKKFGNRVLLTYGGGSIKKNGIYDEVMRELEGFEIFELSGIQPNPDIESVREGQKICRENNIDVILAVGAGSVIDCSKAIAAARYYSGDPWDFFLRKATIKKALPIGVVLTLAATGSETNAGTVISNRAENRKLSTGSLKLKPRFAVMDPTHTYSVSPWHTAAGIVDIMSHVFEQYFSKPETAFVQDAMSEAILKSCIKYGPMAVKDPKNYEARSNILWAGTIGLNGILSVGKESDWMTHMIEHEVSAYHDLTHGVGLAIITPHYLKNILNDETAPLIARYGRNVWSIEGKDDMETSREAIGKTRQFFKQLGIPMTLTEVGIDDAHFSAMAEGALSTNRGGSYKKITKEDIISILKAAL